MGGPREERKGWKRWGRVRVWSRGEGLGCGRGGWRRGEAWVEGGGRSDVMAG